MTSQPCFHSFQNRLPLWFLIPTSCCSWGKNFYPLHFSLYFSSSPFVYKVLPKTSSLLILFLVGKVIPGFSSHLSFSDCSIRLIISLSLWKDKKITKIKILFHLKSWPPDKNTIKMTISHHQSKWPELLCNCGSTACFVNSFSNWHNYSFWWNNFGIPSIICHTREVGTILNQKKLIIWFKSPKQENLTCSSPIVKVFPKGSHISSSCSNLESWFVNVNK